LLFSLIPKESMTIMLDITPEEAFKRKLDIPLIQPIRDRRNLYRMIAKKYGVMTLDAERDCHFTNQIIMRKLSLQ
jgi:hypothetical protein